MFSRQFLNRGFYRLSALCSALALAGAFNVATAAAPTAPNDPPDLGAVPPDLSQSVDPNIIVTFDDSGSMASTFMGDGRPYDGNGTNTTSWQGPWACANLINPDIPSTNTSFGAASQAMNGVYYNPNILYTPPLDESGNAFANAAPNGATATDLQGVWEDGITAVLNGVASGGTGGNNHNPLGAATASTLGLTNLMGKFVTTATPTNYETNAVPHNLGRTLVSAGCPTAVTGDANYIAGSCAVTTDCSGSGASKKCYYTYKLNVITTADNRWKCSSATAGTTYTPWTTSANQNPGDGTAATKDGNGVIYNGGPTYWRFKSSALSSLTSDPITGLFTAAAQTALYTASNWEPVSVPVAQYQNFANWYAYYRYRNLMARTSLSRVFGVIGTPTGSNVRVLWQNINNATYGKGSGSLTGLNTLFINPLDDTSNDPYGSSSKDRAAFFKWIYQVGASGSTPTRTAEIRAGNFLCNGVPGDSNCNGHATSATQDNSNPYWQAGSAGQNGQELACRQNFHMMVTDGLYNQPAVSVSGNGSNTTAATNLGPHIPNIGTNPGQYDDATTYSVGTGATPTTIFNHPAGTGGWTKDADTGSSYSDIAFYYWANNLRPDLSQRTAALGGNDQVPQYFPDQTVGVTGPATAVVDALDPGKTDEVFWNPVNDPATWPHLVQFAVTLGAFGNLTYSTDLDCQKPVDASGNKGNDDACKLRTGQVNSSLKVGWPQPNGAGSGINPNIDDLWHAALNSRGAFFVATDPSSLVQHLTSIIQSVLARSQSSTAETASGSILPGAQTGTGTATGPVYGFSGGYDSGSWSGYLYKFLLDSKTAVALSTEWDAGCTLTSGTFSAIAPSGTKPPSGSCLVPATPPDVNATPPRIVFTSTAGSSGSLVGVPFQYSQLSTTDKAYLDLDPTTTDVNGSTGQVITTPSSTAPATVDSNGTDRVDYLRGKRLNETTPTTETKPRQFRIRKSVLGPVINSQAFDEAGPTGGFSDQYPANSPEQLAAAPCIAGLTASGCNSYEKFVNTNLHRNPVVYVGSNDGMLHAFDSSGNTATDGKELWAYVPNIFYRNGQLDQYTNSKNTLTTTVDDTPVIQDAFIATPSDTTAKWRTILVGSLRLGGRGIYALDVTDPTKPGDENAAKAKFMWEFTNFTDSESADLGYTYASANVARLRCGSGSSTPTNCTTGGTWVVLVASGYFPQTLQVQSSTFGTNSTPNTAPGATANITHLWVLNAGTGKVIKRLDTTSTVTSYGLSTPTVVDFGLDQLDDVSVAGDLAGNLWRFDLSDPDPTKWGVVNIFQSYATTAACVSTGPGTSNQGIGCEPITVMPETFPDPNTGSVIYVFGSGQYLGPTDRTSSSVKGTDHFFGVRDYGGSSSRYPIKEANLISQVLTQSGSNRQLEAGIPVPLTASGWMIPLNISGIQGERDVVKATPLFSAGAAVLTSLIPGSNNDPCTPGRLGAVMAVDAATGGPLTTPPGSGAGDPVTVGAEVINPPAVGGAVVVSPIGGGSVIIPGVGIVGGSGPGAFTINGGLPVWRRTSWRELLNNL